jgi:hypothetical protein
MDEVRLNILKAQLNTLSQVNPIKAMEIQKSIQDELSKSRAGTYGDTPENRKLGRVGQRYGESKNDDKQNDTTLRDLETKLNYAKDFSPHKVGYYEQLIKEHKEKSNPKESTDKEMSNWERAKAGLPILDKDYQEKKKAVLDKLKKEGFHDKNKFNKDGRGGGDSPDGKFVNKEK